MASTEFSVDALHAKLAASRDAGSPLFLSISDVKRALSAFLSGEISKEEIASWAEFFDANDDVLFESDELMPSVMFDISSPEINGWLDEARARELLALFDRSS